METPPREGTVLGLGEAESHNSRQTSSSEPTPDLRNSLWPLPVLGQPPQSLPFSQCSGSWWSRPTGEGGKARLTADPGQRGIQTSHSVADRCRCSTATTRPFTQIRFSSVEDGSLVPRPVLRSLENPA